MKTLCLTLVAMLAMASTLVADPPPRDEFAQANVELGTFPRLESRVITPIASVTLEEGDWDISGEVNYFITGSRAAVYVVAVIAAEAQITLDGFDSVNATQSAPGLGLLPCALPRRRIHLPQPTTVNLIAFAVFAQGNVQPWGFISAVRASRR